MFWSTFQSKFLSFTNQLGTWKTPFSTSQHPSCQKGWIQGEKGPVSPSSQEIPNGPSRLRGFFHSLVRRSHGQSPPTPAGGQVL